MFEKKEGKKTIFLNAKKESITMTFFLHYQVQTKLKFCLLLPFPPFWNHPLENKLSETFYYVVAQISFLVCDFGFLNCPHKTNFRKNIQGDLI